MKATGIVRRIDDLGRVVIPKEIRRTMRIREGDPLEIFTNKEGEVIFKKYSAMESITEHVLVFAEALAKATAAAPPCATGTPFWQYRAYPSANSATSPSRTSWAGLCKNASTTSANR